MHLQVEQVYSKNTYYWNIEMPWIQLRLSANEETAEKYSDWLVACGSQAVTFIDAKDTPIYEP
jgi:ribosomal protein L11 methylase PrmA